MCFHSTTILSPRARPLAAQRLLGSNGGERASSAATARSRPVARALAPAAARDAVQWMHLRRDQHARARRWFICVCLCGGQCLAPIASLQHFRACPFSRAPTRAAHPGRLARARAIERRNSALDRPRAPVFGGRRSRRAGPSSEPRTDERETRPRAARRPPLARSIDRSAPLPPEASNRLKTKTPRLTNTTPPSSQHQHQQQQNTVPLSATGGSRVGLEPTR